MQLWFCLTTLSLVSRLYYYFLICALKRALTNFCAKLGTHCHSCKHNFMLAPVMTECLLQATELFKAPVDSFVPRSSPLLSFFIRQWNIIIRCAYFCWFTSVSPIRFDHLTRWQFIFQLRPEYLEIRPLSARKGAIKPYNTTCLNTNANFVTKSSTLELMRVPFCTKGVGS